MSEILCLEHERRVIQDEGTKKRKKRKKKRKKKGI